MNEGFVSQKSSLVPKLQFSYGPANVRQNFNGTLQICIRRDYV